MSKKISLFFVVEDSVITCNRFTAILEKFCEAGHDVYNIDFTIKDIEVNNSLVKKVIEAERFLKKRFKFKAYYTLSCKFEQLRGLRMRELAKKGFNVKILVDDIEQLHAFSKTKTRISRFELVSVSPGSDFLKLFSDWLFSKDAVDIVNFSDLLKLILMKERNSCEYNSCMGNVLSIDSSGIVYWCKHNKPETALGRTDEHKSLSDLFNSGQFEKYLDLHYQHREYCKSACSLFETCQSGCPLNCSTTQKEKCIEQNFIKFIDHAYNGLRRGIDLGDLTFLNKHARTILVNALAYTPFSDFFESLDT